MIVPFPEDATLLPYIFGCQLVAHSPQVHHQVYLEQDEQRIRPLTRLYAVLSKRADRPGTGYCGRKFVKDLTGLILWTTHLAIILMTG